MTREMTPASARTHSILSFFLLLILTQVRKLSCFYNQHTKDGREDNEDVWISICLDFLTPEKPPFLFKPLLAACNPRGVSK